MGVSKRRIKGELEFMDDAAPMDEREREITLCNQCRVKGLSPLPGFENSPIPELIPGSGLEILLISTLEIPTLESSAPKKCSMKPASPEQRQPSSCVLPNKSLVGGLLCSEIWVYSLAPGCHDIFPFRAATLALVKPFPSEL